MEREGSRAGWHSWRKVHAAAQHKSWWRANVAALCTTMVKVKMFRVPAIRQVLSGHWNTSPLVLPWLEFGDWLWSVFVEGGKPETWRKTLGAREILTTNSAHIWYLAWTQPTSETWPELSPHLIPGRNSAHIWYLAGIEPGPQWWEASSLTLSLHDHGWAMTIFSISFPLCNDLIFVFLFLCLPFFIWEACYDSYPSIIRSVR